MFSVISPHNCPTLLSYSLKLKTTLQKTNILAETSCSLDNSPEMNQAPLLVESAKVTTELKEPPAAQSSWREQKWSVTTE